MQRILKIKSNLHNREDSLVSDLSLYTIAFYQVIQIRRNVLFSECQKGVLTRGSHIESARLPTDNHKYTGLLFGHHPCQTDIKISAVIYHQRDSSGGVTSSVNNDHDEILYFNMYKYQRE